MLQFFYSESNYGQKKGILILYSVQYPSKLSTQAILWKWQFLWAYVVLQQASAYV